jgi:SMC interacting uncharacterized protein involved in chromosome segregation
MLPANLHNYSNDELLRFIDGAQDPLIKELCRRLEGTDWSASLREMEQERDDAVEAADKYESEISENEDTIKALKDEIETLKDLLDENNIAIPA